MIKKIKELFEDDDNFYEGIEKFPEYSISNPNDLKKIDKLTTTLVSYEATIGHLKDALIAIADDCSPPWDKTDFQRIAKEALKGIRK